MERPTGFEPVPGPWQGPVLPLYYGRPNQRNFNTPSIHDKIPRAWKSRTMARIHHGPRPSQARSLFRTCNAMGSADLQYPRSFYDRGFSLALRKFGGLFPVRIHTSKPLPVFIKHCDLPVFVLRRRSLPSLVRFRAVLLFWAWFEYLNEHSRAQVAIRSIVCTEANYTAIPD